MRNLKPKRLLSIVLAILILPISSFPVFALEATENHDYGSSHGVFIESEDIYTNIEAVSLAGNTLEDHEISAFEVTVLNGVNLLRIQEGLQPLAMKSSLAYAAYIRARETVIFMDAFHNRPCGRGTFTAFDDAGVPLPRGWWAANAARGQMFPWQVMQNWMNSPGHLENMLRPMMYYIGVGHHFSSDTMFRNYWYQFFISGAPILNIEVSGDMFYIEQGGRIEDTDATIWVDNMHGERQAFFPILAEMIEGLNSDELGIQEITISHAGFTRTFYVEVRKRTIILGDINDDGYVNIMDLQLLLRHVSRRDMLTEERQLLAADVNRDGNVDILDLRLLLQYVSRRIDSFD